MANHLQGSLLDIAYHLPDNVVTNDDFKKSFPDWDVDRTEKRTGVFERRIAKPEETAYDLSLVAVRKLLDKHDLLMEKIDAIIFCTQSGDYIMPSNAFLLHRDLRLKSNVLAFDYNLACSGYIYGLVMALSFIRSGIAKNVLLVTSDTYSKYMKGNDRSTRMLFGDGASASWIGPTSDFSNPLITSFGAFKLETDGNGWDKFIIKSGANRQPPTESRDLDYSDKIYMDGLRVLGLVNDRVVNQVHYLLRENAMAPEDIDQFFFHQASRLALNSLKIKLKLRDEKMFSNIKNIGNTVSSSIPILISDYFSQKKLISDSRLLLCGFGVGFSWASIIATK